MKVFELNIGGVTENKNIPYTISIQDYSGNWNTVFYGKVFVVEGQTKVRIDVGDILWNYKFNGDNYVSPKINSNGDNYVMCDCVDNLTNCWYNYVKVELPDYNSYVSKYVSFYNYNMFGYNSDSVSAGTVAIEMDYQPIAHIPANAPSGFSYRQLVWSGTFTKDIDGTTTSVSRSKLGTIEFTGGTEYYGIGDTKIAQIDSCSKPYYLVWITNTGGMQVQPFLKSSEFSVEYTYNNRIDMSDFEWSFKKTTRGKWKLKSQNLSDKDYKAYGEMFNSQYLILLDMINNKLHYVNIKDTTYNEKHNTIGNKIYFEVTLESAEVK